jgi:hypothetical protein
VTELSAPPRGSHRWILLICLVAFAFRLAAAVLHPVTDRVAYPDAGDYHDLGTALATGGAYRAPAGIAVRMPGYPLVIAAVYSVAGERPLAVLTLQAAMGAATCYLVWATLRKVSPAGALLATMLVAVDPLSIVLSASLLSESAFSLAFVALVAAAGKLWGRPGSVIHWLLFALLAAVAIYLRAAALYLPAALAAAIVARHFSLRSCAGMALALIVIVAALLPWKLFLAAHPETAGLKGLTSLEGLSLYEAVYPDATGGPKQDAILKSQPPEIQQLTEAQRDTHYAQLARAEIRQHPARVLALAPIKAARTWNPGLNAEQLGTPALQLVLWVWHILLFLLAAIGLVARLLPAKLRVVLALPILYFACLHMLFIGSVRYRVPLHPLLCMLAAVGVMTLLKNRQRPGNKTV